MSYFNSDGAFASTNTAGTVLIPANAGLSIDGSGFLTNTDRGSQAAFIKSIAVQGDGVYTATSNTATITFVPAGRIVMTFTNATLSITDNAKAPKTHRCRDYLGFFTQPDVEATQPEDTFTFVEGGNGGLRITTSATDKTITFTHNGILSIATSGTGISVVTSGTTATIVSNATSTNVDNTIVSRDENGYAEINGVTLGYRSLGTTSSTVTIDMSGPSMIRAGISGTTTFAFTNVVGGRELVIIIFNTSGVSGRTINYGTGIVSTDNNTSFTLAANRSAVLRYYSTGTTQAGMYVNRGYI